VFVDELDDVTSVAMASRILPSTFAPTEGTVAITAEQSERITTALAAKLKGQCPLCFAHQWVWQAELVEMDGHAPPPGGLQGLAQIYAARAGQVTSTPPVVFPTMPVMCGNCGHTVFMNVYVLGIADIWQLPPQQARRP
jgi:hypothetical protein